MDEFAELVDFHQHTRVDQVDDPLGSGVFAQDLGESIASGDMGRKDVNISGERACGKIWRVQKMRGEGGRIGHGGRRRMNERMLVVTCSLTSRTA